MWNYWYLKNQVFQFFRYWKGYVELPKSNLLYWSFLSSFVFQFYLLEYLVDFDFKWYAVSEPIQSIFKKWKYCLNSCKDPKEPTKKHIFQNTIFWNWMQSLTHSVLKDICPEKFSKISKVTSVANAFST